MRKRNLYVSAGIVAIILISWLISCAVNPVTGKRELMLLSENDELALGKQTDQEVTATYGIYDDPELLAYISKVGNDIAPLTHRPNLEWKYKILDTPVVNAFAVPGGYIYFTRGILCDFNDEAEMAGVMGHEFGHVTARHSAVQYSRAQLAQLGLGVGAIFSERFRQYAGIAQFGVSMLFLKFSRDNETQADQLGVEYSTKAGYNSLAMADFFNTLERMSPSEGGAIPDWFSTHPNTKGRQIAVTNLTAEWQQQVPGKTFVYNRDQYLAKVDGIAYGEDPQQGYVEGNSFYHPGLGFTFPVPGDWQLSNTPSQVQVVSPQQNAVIMFSLDDAASPALASQNFAQNSSAVVSASDAVTVNGFNAQRTVSNLTTDQGELKVLSYYIAKDNKVYVFHGFSDTANFATYENNFSNTMSHFQRLTDPAKLNVAVKHIHVKTVNSTTTLRSALKANGIADADLEELSLVNGMLLDDQVKAGTKIKIVSK